MILIRMMIRIVIDLMTGNEIRIDICIGISFMISILIGIIIEIRNITVIGIRLGT